MLGGHRKAVYARRSDGRVVAVPSSGWDVEETATTQAVDALQAQADIALRAARAGQGSALEYWMYERRSDVPLLASMTGFGAWRVRRHLRRPWAMLAPRLRRRYAAVLGLSLDELGIDGLPSKALQVARPEASEPHGIGADEGRPADAGGRADAGERTARHYVHRHAAHCESGVASGLLRHAGIEVTEATAFGLSAALAFAFIPFVRINGLPLFAYRMPPGAVVRGVCKAFGLRMRSRRFRNDEQGRRGLDAWLAEGTPVGAQVGVFWLPYFPPAMRFHYNAHNLVVCGRDGEDYLVSDPVGEKTVRCDVAALTRARFSRGPLAPKGLIYRIESSGQTLPSPAFWLKAIRRNARRMLAPIGYVGVNGIGTVARRLERLPVHESRSLQWIGHLVRMQEEIGTGGAGFRFMYAAFLQEAAERTGRVVLAMHAQSMIDIGDAWRAFALRCARMIRKREPFAPKDLADMLDAIADCERELFRSLLRDAR